MVGVAVSAALAIASLAVHMARGATGAVGHQAVGADVVQLAANSRSLAQLRTSVATTKTVRIKPKTGPNGRANPIQ